MTERPRLMLPLHELLVRLEAWRGEPADAIALGELRAALERLVEAYQARGAFLVIDAEHLPALSLGAGSLFERPTDQSMARLQRADLQLPSGSAGKATVWIDGTPEVAANLVDAVTLAVDAILSRQEAALQRQQLETLDVAVRGIAEVLSVERVLQLIVDRVRELVAAQYAALGIVGPFRRITQFITSGVTPEERAAIGDLPRGRGLLGLIIDRDESFLISDIATDPRRFGFPPNHPEMHAFLGVPVRSKGGTIGNLYLTNKLTAREFSDADLRLVEMFGLHAGIAIENARLHEEIQRLAVVSERERISQDLHDSIIQSLYAISLSLEDLPEIITEDAVEGAARAERAIESIHGTIRDIRNFIMGLQPTLLEETDLGGGIEALAAEFRANTLIDLEVLLTQPIPEMSPEHAGHLLAITREALSNVARHSGATRVTLELATLDGMLRLVIGDNGRGFDTGAARGTHQHGLANLRSRAESAGGMLALTSEFGVGTRVEANIPLAGDGDE